MANADTAWRKSTWSGGNARCVEVRWHAGVVQVRHSNDPGGPVLAFDPEAWRAFVAAVREA